MANPENLFQRSGVWWIRYSVDGRLIRSSLETSSLREAKRLRNEVLGTRDSTSHVRENFGLTGARTEGVPVPSFREVAQKYIAHRAATSKAHETTLTLERQRIENWLIPKFGARRVTSVSHDDVATYIGSLRKAKAKRGSDPLGRAQIHKVFQALNRIYRYATRRGHATVNPCDLEPDERPEPSKAREVRLTESEIPLLLTHLGPDTDLGRMARTALEVGLRWGELNGLAWDDLDLETAVYTVRRSFEGPPKNKAAGVATELMPSIAAALRTWKETSTSGWVFPGKRGKLRSSMPDSQRVRIFTAAKKAGITKHITPHIFRHTFGSRVYEQTHDVKATQRLMRHADVLTTLRVYVHDERPLADVVAALNPIELGRALQIVT